MVAGWQPILYAGLVSVVGVAYTLQVVGQKSANPAHAAIILSLESVFAAIGGVWLLDETLSLWAWCGCGLMMAGMLLSQAGALACGNSPCAATDINLNDEVGYDDEDACE